MLTVETAVVSLVLHTQEVSFSFFAVLREKQRESSPSELAHQVHLDLDWHVSSVKNEGHLGPKGPKEKARSGINRRNRGMIVPASIFNLLKKNLFATHSTIRKEIPGWNRKMCKLGR